MFISIRITDMPIINNFYRTTLLLAYLFLSSFRRKLSLSKPGRDKCIVKNAHANNLMIKQTKIELKTTK